MNSHDKEIINIVFKMDKMEKGSLEYIRLQNKIIEIIEKNMKKKSKEMKKNLPSVKWPPHSTTQKRRENRKGKGLNRTLYEE